MTSPKPPSRQRLAIIACGSRTWVDVHAIHVALDAMGHRGLDCLIHGAAPGADMIACGWARSQNIQRLGCPAQWERDGKAAGPIRNAAMLGILRALEGVGYAIEVHAWPLGESRGTRSMMALARKAGVVVVEHQLGAAKAS